MSPNSQWSETVAFLGALSSGLMAGVFFAFSNFVMKALARLPAPHGMAAMQSINATVLNPGFLGTLLLAAGVSVVGLGTAVVGWDQPGAFFLALGGLLFMGGSLFVTAAFNVPRNEALAGVAQDDPDQPGIWCRYLAGWTAWNHVRTIAAIGAAGMYCAAMIAVRCS